MKKIAKIVYSIKMLLFIVQFYFVFIMLHNILDTRVYGIIFIVFYLIFVLKTIIELLSKKQRYKNDYIYNIMQLGIYIYLLIVSIKTTVFKVYVTRNTIEYFKTNYIILSLLIVFVLVYSYLERKSNVKQQ